MNEAIIVENLTKKFCRGIKRTITYGMIDILKDLFNVPYDRTILRKKEFYAIQNINFNLKKGEILGIVGLNGAGKSTLLRLLNGIFPPDKGKIIIDGKLGGLIALGAGFHPHMSGRENIFLNGVILGMTRKEIKNKLDSIIEFSELGNFIDAPVSTYSSGMYVRLGFAIAIHSEPEILLIDEVLSVGDISFQNKCMRQIAALRKKNKSIIFVSHNMDYIKLLCNRVILLDKGKIIAEGDPDNIVARYLDVGRERELENYKLPDKKLLGLYTKDIQFNKFGLLDKNNNPTNETRAGDDIKIFYDFTANKNINYPVFGFGIQDVKNLSVNAIYEVSTEYEEGKKFKFISGKQYRIVLILTKPNLIPGVYKLKCCFYNNETFELYHDTVLDDFREIFLLSEEEVFAFSVNGKKYPYNATIDVPASWECKLFKE